MYSPFSIVLVSRSLKKHILSQVMLLSHDILIQLINVMNIYLKNKSIIQCIATVTFITGTCSFITILEFCRHDIGESDETNRFQS